MDCGPVRCEKAISSTRRGAVFGFRPLLVFVRFPDDHRLAVFVLRVVVLFFFIIVIIGVARRHHIDNEAQPSVVRIAWGHVGLPLDVTEGC